MKVVTEGEESHKVPVDSSVPLGTVLGPVLYLCHINDLPKDAVTSMPLCWWLSPAQENQLTTRSPNYPIRPKWARMMGRYMGHAFSTILLNIFSGPTPSPQLLLSEQPHITIGWLQSLPTNSWPEMDDSHQQHHKEGQLHPRLLVQKPLALPTLLQENSLHLPCPLCLRILCCSLALPAKWHWQTRKHPETCSLLHPPNYKDHTPGCVTNMLRDLWLQSLQDRRK